MEEPLLGVCAFSPRGGAHIKMNDVFYEEKVDKVDSHQDPDLYCLYQIFPTNDGMRGRTAQ